MTSAKRSISLVLATLVALLAPMWGISLASAADPELAGRALLYRKHVDSAHIAWEADGLHVRVVDGATVRPADEVAIRLGPDAAEDGTEVSRLRVSEKNPELSFLGAPGTIHWLAPSAYYPGWPPVWAGMGAGQFPDEVLNNPNVSERILPESVHLTLDAVDGPGSVEMFNWNGSAGTVSRHLSSTDPAFRKIHMTPGAHGHFNWTFSKAGRYKLKMTAHATSMGGKEYSSPQSSLLWLVGSDAEVGLPVGTTKAATITKPVDAPVVTPTTQPTTQPTSTVVPTQTATPTSSPTTKPYDPLAYNPTKDRTCAHLGKGHMDMAGHFNGKFNEDGWPVTPKIVLSEDSTGKVVDRESYESVMEIGEHAKTKLGPSPGASALRKYFGDGATLFTVPEVQDPNVPWLGFNTEHTDYSKLDHTRYHVTVTGPEGAKMAVGHTDAQGNFVVDMDSERNGQNAPLRFFEKTHTHKAFFFDKPGFYDLDISYFVVGKGKSEDGDLLQNYGFFTTTFAVGQAAIDNACERSLKPSASPSASATASATPSATASSTAKPSVTPSASTSATPSASPSATPTPSVTPSATPSATPDRPSKVTLDRGHVDAFFVTNHGDKLNLALREDVTGQHVVRTPEEVLLHVLPTAEIDLPAGAPGAPRGFLLPMTQDPKLLWPGWDTNAVRELGMEEVRFQIGVEGPGDVHVFSSDFTGVTSLLADGGTKLPNTLVAPFPAHTHANWVFTKAGEYKMTVTASGNAAGKTLTSAPAIYTWRVGELPKPTASPTPVGPDAGPQPVAQVSPVPSPQPKPSDNPKVPQGQLVPQTGGGKIGGSNPGKAEQCIPTKVKVPAGQGAPAAAASATQMATSGHFDVGARLVDDKLVLSVKDDRQAPAAWVDPTSLTFGLGAAALTKAPAGMEFIAAAGNPVHVVASVQQAEVPWIGVNTMHESIVNDTTGEVTLRLDGVEGPGSVAAFMSGALGGGVGQRMFDNVGGPKEYTIPANTHAHPNWVFSAPGSYKVNLTATATTKAGKQVSSSASLTFAVGDVPAPKAAAQPAPKPVASGQTAMVEKVVGKTASGADCNLAGTGSDVDPAFLAGAAALVLLGSAGVAVAVRKR